MRQELFTSPQHLSPEHRLTEVATLLGKALVRLRNQRSALQGTEISSCNYSSIERQSEVAKTR